MGKWITATDKDICEHCFMDFEQGQDAYKDGSELWCEACYCEINDGFESDEIEFADPYGNSALRAESPSNPRNLPCPTCHAENVLTPKDRALGYQCDACADRLERGGI